MPIKIYIEDTFEEIAFLNENTWDLPQLLESLEIWVSKKSLKPNNYVADIGFYTRKNPSGGGGILSRKSLNLLSQIGMEVHLSEYPEPK